MQRRRWLDDETYGELVGLCQFLPGPTSSEVGIAIGLLRGGTLGAFAAWLGFTLPSALLMLAFAYAIDRLPPELVIVTRALQLVALVVVGVATWQMARALAWDSRRGAIALVAALFALDIVRFAEPQFTQVWIIAAAALVGWLALPAAPPVGRPHPAVPIGRRTASLCAALFVALLVLLPVARHAYARGEIALADSFYRSGALVFGGGHVVLPLLRAEVVPSGWVSEERFLAGYGAAQVLPGPLFAFAAYLGASVEPAPVQGDPYRAWPPHGIAGAAIATLSIFFPAFLLVFAALPSWGALRTRPWVQRALRGVNAAVVGLLLAALIALARTAIASVV